MNGPPNEKAAPVLDTQEAAEEENASEMVAEFDALRIAAAAAGHTLTRTVGGFMLHRWSYSRHFTDWGDVKRALLTMGIKP